MEMLKLEQSHKSEKAMFRKQIYPRGYNYLKKTRLLIKYKIHKYLKILNFMIQSKKGWCCKVIIKHKAHISILLSQI